MGRKTLIGIVAGLAVLLGAAVAAYAYDASKANEIAEGVTVGDVDVGGLSEAEARDLLTEELVEPLDEAIVVKYDGEQFTLSKNDLDVSADVEGMVAEASAASRDDPLPVRVFRYATGGTVDQEIEPRVAYDEFAVERFVEGVASNLNQDPIDASIEPSTTDLAAVQGQPGITVDEDDLRTQIDAALQQTDAKSRVVHPSVTTVQQEVTKEELGERYPTYITIDRAGFTLRLFKDLELVEEYTIAVGASGYDTPTGLYSITDKTVDPTWYVPDAEWAGDLAGTVVPGGSPDNPLVARWLGFYSGAGIHGTNDIASLGSAASHGCIRMDPDQVIELYDRVPVGTPLYIQ
ncbi:MAG: L,D-transpeptidase/peptidoglycan binding protein [Thermoleophilaceae bacterium]